jgi:hypothetical protein
MTETAGIEPEVIRLLNERLGDRSKKVDQDRLRALATFDPNRTTRYNVARNYYEGEQKTILTDRQKAYLERAGVEYCENFCSTVVDALAERLSLNGVTTDLAYDDPDTGEKGDDLGEWLWGVYDQNRGDELQTTVHSDAVEAGDAYLMVDWDAEKGRPRLSFNTPELISPIYDNQELLVVVKVWNTSRISPVNPKAASVKRMNLYYPDRIEKWFTLGADKKADWVEWLDDGDKVWPVPWMDSEGKPLGIPAFHFANGRYGDHFGRPEHYPTIPQQDRLNKELLDLASVMDAQGFPQRWALGLSDTSGLTTDPGVVWTSENPGATFGQFPSADPSGLLKSIESTLIRMATRSRTPAHLIYLSGGLPSGESLKTAESGLVAKAKKRQVYFGGVWAEAFRMAGLVALTFGAAEEQPPFDLKELRECQINVQWADPVTRNEKEHLDSLTLMGGLGVSKDTILSMIPGVDASTERDKNERDEAASGEALMAGVVNPAEVTPFE